MKKPGRRPLGFGALLAVVLVVGCTGLMEEPAYRPTPLPANDADLFQVHGNAESDEVWIFEQGGPLYELDPRFRPFLNRALPDSRDLLLVQVHQTLTLNPGLAARHQELSLAELQAEVDVSVEILRRTIRHFKAQGKRVVVMGYSYGAFVVTRYLWREGPDAADRYVIMAGRLDMPPVVVEGFLNQEPYYFPDAVNPKPDPAPAEATDQELMRRRIMGATGYDRYTDRLSDTDLRKVIYAYGTNDTIVGRLSEAEVRFLRSKGSTVIAPEVGHGEVLSAAAPQIVAALNG